MIFTAADLDRIAAYCAKAVEIPGLPSYLACPHGEIFSTSGWRGMPIRKMIAHPNRHGYCRVRLSCNGRRKHFPIHVLIARTFLPAKPSGKNIELRHLDGIKSNNAVTNICWGTRKQNAEDRSLHGRTAIGSRNGFSSLDERRVGVIKSRLLAGESQRSIAKDYDVSGRTIGLIANGDTWKHVEPR